MLTFKIGQKIKIKTQDWFNCVKDLHTGWVKRYGECFTNKMAETLCNKIFTIKSILDDKFYVIEDEILIFEYAVDIIDSAKLNNITLPDIIKGELIGYDNNDTRTIAEIKELLIYKINNDLEVNAFPLLKEPVIETIKTKRKAGRPKGSKNKINTTNENVINKQKIENGELVICWTNPNKTDFCLGIYQSTKGKNIEVLIGDETKIVSGIMKYNKENFDKITADTVNYLRNINKDLELLNKTVFALIKEFETKYSVKLSSICKLTILK